MTEAQQRVDELWKQGQEALDKLLWAALANPFGGETTYRVALIKHEQAERLQARMDTLGKPLQAGEAQAVQDAWKSAADWWRTFAQAYPGGDAPSRRLRARALDGMGQRDAAVDLLQDLSGRLSDMEKTARLYRAQQLKMKQAPAKN